jgi:hypothetical protein
MMPMTTNETPLTVQRLRVAYGGETYPAEPVAKGAAYEIFAADPAPGFLRNPRPGARMPFRRFVPATEVKIVEGQPPEPTERPLSVPLSRALSWSGVHRLGQTPHEATSELVTTIRRSVQIRRGTRMIKVLSAKQLAGHLHGWMPQGFCYREFDVAHLRTPAELAVLRSDGADGVDDVVFAMRWRAIDPQDYEIPFAADFPGLTRMPPRDRLGPPILGTGFAPSDQHVIPEYVTAHLADLPLPAFAELLAYTADGTEVVLYSYVPEQRTWSRMFGPQWRRLFAEVPGVAPEQEYFPVPQTPGRLIGWYRGQEYEAVANPPGDFRILAKTRSFRYPVEALARRTPYVSWRGASCTIIRDEGEWLRVRLIRPEADAVALLGAGCVERGIYEAWAPLPETSTRRDLDIRYELPPP